MKVFIILAMLFNCVLASAAEFDYQPKKGEKAVELSARYFIDKTKATSGFESDLTDTLVKLSFEYGVSDVSSFYANIGYGTASQDPADDEFEGMDSLNLGYKFSQNRIFTAFNLGINAFEDFDCGNDDCNRSLGNIGFVGKLGYYFIKSDDVALAAYWDQAIFSTEAQLEDGSRAPLSYGSSLSVAYEKMKETITYGGILSYNYNTFSPGPSASVGNLGYFSFNGVAADSVTLNGYTRYTLNDRQSIFASASYTYVVDHEEDLIDSQNVIMANLGFRQLF